MKNKKLKKKYNKRGMALSQIIIILFGIVAFSYVLGSEIGFVSAAACSGNALSPPGTGNIFCYGGSSSGYHTYTATSSTQIDRDDGAYYTKSGAVWVYHLTNGATGNVDSSTEGSLLSTWNSYANTATGNYQSATPPALQTCSERNGVQCGAGTTCTDILEVSDPGIICCRNQGACLADNPNPATPPPTTTDAEGVNNNAAAFTKLATDILLTGKTEGVCIEQLKGVLGAEAAAIACRAASAAITGGAGGNTPPPAGDGDTPTALTDEQIKTAGYTVCLQSKSQAQCNALFGVTVSSPSSPQESPWDAAWAKLTGGGVEGKGLSWFVKKVVPVQTLGGGILNIFAAAGTATAIIGAFELGRGLLADFFAEHPGLEFAYSATEAAVAGFGFGLVGAPTIATVFGFEALTPLAAGGLGALVGIAYFLITYRENKIDAVIFQCLPWQTPIGGSNCELCGQNGIDCTAYQCGTLGTECELVNTGAGEGNPACVRNESDAAPPTISFLDRLPGGYTYAPSSPPAEYPRDTGVLITYTPNSEGKIPYNVVLPLGVSTNEVSRCRIDFARRDSISDMLWIMHEEGENLWGTEHLLNIPILKQSDSQIAVDLSGQTNLYVRCEDKSGHADVNAFNIQFVVDTEPDGTPPTIEGTSVLNGASVPFGTNSMNVQVYVNEPVSGCKWDRSNFEYSSTTATGMSCPNSMTTQGFFTGTYPCTATLTGLNDGVENTFYFLCNDTAGNIPAEPEIYKLVGSQALAITSVTPENGTLIKDSTDSVKVTLIAQTAAGAKNGKATCSYSTTGTGEYTSFAPPHNTYQHSTDVHKYAGSYRYYIRCFDEAGNFDEESVTFTVETDTTAPVIVRASHENADLSIKTDEESRCVYDIVDCNYPFEEGISMTTAGGTTHTASWVSGRTYYIKCEDEFGNNPQNSCSVNGELSSSQF